MHVKQNGRMKVDWWNNLISEAQNRIISAGLKPVPYIAETTVSYCRKVIPLTCLPQVFFGLYLPFKTLWKPMYWKQGFKRIRQWPNNCCTFQLMMIYIFCKLQLMVETFGIFIWWKTIQNLTKAPKVVKPTNKITLL